MLNDPERKLLRILNNYHIGKKHIPSFDELKTKTGRHEQIIRNSLKILKEKGFIDWNGVNSQSILIIRAWEEEQPAAPKSHFPYGKI